MDRVYILSGGTNCDEEIFERPICFKNIDDAIHYVENLEKEEIICDVNFSHFQDDDYGVWWGDALLVKSGIFIDFTITESDLI